jgi:hypothetical protein
LLRPLLRRPAPQFPTIAKLYLLLASILLGQTKFTFVDTTTLNLQVAVGLLPRAVMSRVLPRFSP